MNPSIYDMRPDEVELARRIMRSVSGEAAFRIARSIDAEKEG